VASSQSEPSRPAEHTPDKLVAAKAQLAAILKAELGEHAAKFLPEIERKQSLGELEEWSRKLVIKLKLTLSQKAANALEAHLRSLFS